MKRRILALSRDRGSMQAIAPVIAALRGLGDLEVTTYATHHSWPVTIEMNLCAAHLDDEAFAANPSQYLCSLFEAHSPHLVLSGSSPARGPAPETPEQFAIQEAHRRNIVSLSVQDYWGMYVERFSRDGRSLAKDLLPDRLCVLDRRALNDLVAFGVPMDQMVVTHNPWLDRLVEQITNNELAQPLRRATRDITVLLISQPLAEMRRVRGWGYDQYTLYEYLLAAMPNGGRYHAGATLRVLPHPAENAAQWKSLFARNERANINVVLCQNASPVLLRDADYVVTSHSTLAYEALYFGTPCIMLRPTAEIVLNSWIEDAGLAQVFYDVESLRRHLATSDPACERNKGLQLKQELEAAGLFFSDGKATDRVVDETLRLLNDTVTARG